MVGKKNQSALLAKYFSMYKKDPRSRVFAPLAESFRKLGMLEDAYKILREGIRNHPNYTLGYIVLAHCYYDEEKYELTYNTLRPIINQNADNISLQKIFAQACINLGHLEEALDTYKYLLFLNPQDKFFAEQVKKLEDDLMVGHKKMSLEQIIKSPEDVERKIEQIPSEDDDWVQVNFTQPSRIEAPKEIEPSEALEEEQWVMKKPTLEDHPILKTDKIEERSLEDDFYADEFEEEGDIDEVNDQEITTDMPFVSHTLIDLYCSQRYYDKAIELLEKILELNPDDETSRKKLSHVLDLKKHDNGKAESSEEEGHDELISIIENKVKVKSPKEKQVEEVFNKFLNLLKEKSIEYR